MKNSPDPRPYATLSPESRALWAKIVADPQPPSALSPESRALWAKIVSVYAFDDAGLLILRCALESFDRAAEAAKILASEGIVTVDKFGQKKAHPAVLIERDAKSAMVRALRSLGLEAK